MDIRKRAALIVTTMNVSLTVFKFILYYLTGSLVILAEAWHSFSDIATSLFVLIAVSKGLKDEKRQKIREDLAEKKDIDLPADTNKKKWNMETKVSLGIGTFLLMVSIMLIRYVLRGERADVAMPIIAGLIFIGFAIGSYLISRFEGSIGQRFNSVGLLSDSMHAKADMTASLMAGFSLILYGMNIDIDRWVALIISFFILSYALEVMVNVIVSKFRGDDGFFFELKTYQIIGFLFNPRKIAALFNNWDENHGFGLMQKKWFKRSIRITGWMIPGLLIVVYLSTAVYTIGPTEKGIVLRFGKAITKTAVEPGLHMKAPWPIDRIQRYEISKIQSLQVGNVTNNESKALLWTQVHGTEEAFLTGDNYFMFPYIILHYRVKDLYSFLYTFENPLTLVEDLTNQVVSQIIAERTFYSIVTDYRSYLSQRVLETVQQKLDEINAGIDIVSVNLKDIHPPISIADSFEQVIAALQEKEQMINEAYAYQNSNIPETRGQAIRKVEQAEAYVVENVDRSEGDAQRFSLQNEIFKKHASLLSKHLHLKTMETAIADSKKIIYDPKAGHPSIWMGNKGMESVPWQGGNE